MKVSSAERRSWRGALPAALSLAVLAFACGPARDPAGQRPLDTVDVAPRLGSAVDPEADPKAVARQQGVAGALPGDFPRDLPLYSPSSLIDFGAGAAGERFVVLFSPDEATAVRAGQTGRLTAAGWRGVAGREGLYRKGASSVRVVVSAARPGCEIRIEY